MAAPTGHASAAGTPIVWKAHQGPATCLAYSPGGSVLASGGKDGVVWLGNAAAASVRLCLAGGKEGVLKLWGLPSGRPRAAVRAEGRPFQALAFSPHGGTLAAGGADGNVRLWDVAALLGRKASK